MSSRLILIVSALVLGANVALAQEEEETFVPTTVEELLDAIGETMAEHDVPAVGLALVDTSGPVWVGSLGKADLETDRDADADTLYRVGSTSKMFVALSVLQLVEDGRLSLDDKLADLAPEVEFENRWEDTDPIRVAHLLEHTTGWDDIHLTEYAHNDPRPAKLKEALDFHPHSRSSRWKPGTRSSYCNSGPTVAAYIVQKITGQDFEDYVAENFFVPLQMKSATFRLSEGVKQNGATLYTDGVATEYSHIAMRPSGSVNASPNDMAAFLRVFLGRGTVDGVQYVRPESIDRMERAATTNGARAGLETGYGLHNYTSSHESWVYHSHNGIVIGGRTQFSYLPEAGAGYAFMINTGSDAAFGEISDLIRNFQTRELAPPVIPEAVAVEDGDRDVAGLYQVINPRRQVAYFLDRVLGVQRLWFEGDELQRKRLLGGAVRRYAHAGNGLFRSPDTGLVALGRAEDPLAGEVIHAGNQVLKPVSSARVYGQLAVVILWGLVIASSFLYFLVWGVRKLRGRVPPGPSTRIRVWPLLASLSTVGAVLLFAMGMSNRSSIFETLGRPTAISVGVMLLSIAFAVFGVLGAHAAVKYRATEMNRFNYWYCSASSGIHLIVLLYLAWFGVIGIQTWA